MAIKGQNLRIFVSENGGSTYKCIAAATNCTVNVESQTESESTKDSMDWDEITVTGKSWSFSTESLFVASDDGALTSADLIKLVGKKVRAKFTPTSGDKNRTAGGKYVEGDAIITSANISAQNRQNGTISINAVGNGPLA